MSKKPTPSRPTTARDFLVDWAEKDASKLSIRQSAKKLEELIALANQDIAQCRHDADRQAIWFVLVGGLEAFNARIGHSPAVEGLHSALANRSYGKRGPSVLDRSSPAIQQRSVEEDFDRARHMVAQEKNPTKSKIIRKKACKQFGLSPMQWDKFKENYDQARIPSQALQRNIDDLRARYDNGDLVVFDDLLK